MEVKKAEADSERRVGEIVEARHFSRVSLPIDQQ